MVKRIKNKKKNKKNKNKVKETTDVVETQAEQLSESESVNTADDSTPSDEEAPISPLSVSDQLKLEIKSNAAYNADNFADLTERVLLSFTEHWQMILVLFAVVASVYGFIGLNHHWVTEDNSSQRIELVKAKASYQLAQDQQLTYLKKKAKWYQDNPEALTSPNFGEAPALSVYKDSAEQFKTLQGELDSQGSIALAKLGEAGARFDMAEKSDDFSKVAQQYLDISNTEGVVPFVKALALQNAATAYEKSAYRAAKKDASKLWETAGQTWQKLAELDRDVFGMFAGLKQAKNQVKNGQNDQAKKTLESLQTAFEAQLKDPKNQSWKKKIQRALARL
jgi:hypothetical protein